GWRFLVEGPGAGGSGIDAIQVRTDSNGEFLLEPEPGAQPPPWNYVITETLPPDCINTEPGDGILWQEVVLGGGSPTIATVEFGNYCTTVGGTVGNVDKFGVLAPWLGLVLIAIGGLGCLIRRRLIIHT
ncbi:hypothetical protein ACFLVX_05720, partial [Chloroflexota bacterium]